MCSKKLRISVVNNSVLFFAMVFLCVFLSIGSAVACSTFSIVNNKKHIIFAGSYDWAYGDGYVITNHRNIKKKRWLPYNDTPVFWISKYGSITFNQYGKEYPFGGINEKSLVVEVLWLENTQYPDPDKRMGIDVLGWVQYQLDNSASIYDVINSNKNIRILPKEPPLHFFICDSNGNTLAVEFLNGKALFYHGTALPNNCLTNSKYTDSLAYLKEYKGFGGEKKINYFSGNSFDRFTIIAERANKAKVKSQISIIDYSFKVLNAVRDGENTQFQIVYDIKHKQIHFRSRRSYKRKSLKIDNFDFKGTSNQKMIDINTSYDGNIDGKFVAYDPKITKNSALKAIRETKAKQYYVEDMFSELLDLNTN